jgi:rRNA biogenesis protein RRP5
MAVQSVEDHGYILTTGVDGITGFCHNKDAKKYIESHNNGNSLVEGQLVQSSILSVAENKRTVNVTLDPKIVSDVSVSQAIRLHIPFAKYQLTFLITLCLLST